MPIWEVRIGHDIYRFLALVIETPAGERVAREDPYESSAAMGSTLPGRLYWHDTTVQRDR